MAGRVSAGTSPSDVRKVLAAKQCPAGKGRSFKVNDASTAPTTFSLGDAAYYLTKGETITFQGLQYSTPATVVYYPVGQHNCTTMYKALVDGELMVVFVVKTCLLLKEVSVLLM
jgi:hypothetical protein